MSTPPTPAPSSWEESANASRRISSTGLVSPTSTIRSAIAGESRLTSSPTSTETEATGAAPAHPTQAEDLWNEVGYYMINVSDLEASASFFAGPFGWQFAEPNDSPAGGRGRHVESPIVPFGLHAGGTPVETALIHPYFRVRDLAEAVARVAELGGTVISQEAYASGGGAVCDDPTGIRFDLWQPAEGY